MFPHLPPWSEFTSFYIHYYNLIQPTIIILMSLKVCYLWRVIAHYSPLNNQASKLIMTISKIETNNLLIFKTWITFNPIGSLLLVVVCYLVGASYIVMVSERINMVVDFFGYHQSGTCFNDHLTGVITTQATTYTEAFWLLTITFLTVGYGDFFPQTHIGRIIALFTVLLGQIYAAMIIGLVHNQLRLTNVDRSAFNFFETKQYKDNCKGYAIKSIAACLRMNIIKK